MTSASRRGKKACGSSADTASLKSSFRRTFRVNIKIAHIASSSRGISCQDVRRLTRTGGEPALTAVHPAKLNRAKLFNFTLANERIDQGKEHRLREPSRNVIQSICYSCKGRLTCTRRGNADPQVLSSRPRFVDPTRRDHLQIDVAFFGDRL